MATVNRLDCNPLIANNKNPNYRRHCDIQTLFTELKLVEIDFLDVDRYSCVQILVDTVDAMKFNSHSYHASKRCSWWLLVLRQVLPVVSINDFKTLLLFSIRLRLTFPLFRQKLRISIKE